MTTLKKLLAITMALAMVFALTGCKKTETDPKTDNPAGNEANKPAGDKPATDGTIKFGTSADFAPYEFHKMVDGKDVILGADVELAKAIAAELGKELEIVDMNFDFLLPQVEEGKIDFVIASINVTPDRLKQADFSDVYYASKHVVLIKKDMESTYTSVESFKGKTLAAQAGSIQEGQLKDYFANSEHVILKKVPDEVAQLKNNKVDGVVLEYDVAMGYANQHEDLVVAPFVVEEATGAAVGVKKGNTELLEAINKVIEKTSADGSFPKWLEQAAEQAAE